MAISVKNQNFPTLVHFVPRWRGSLWNWVLALGVKKLEWLGYRANMEVWHIQSCGYNAPTWQTDGQWATAKTVLMHSVTWQKLRQCIVTIYKGLWLLPKIYRCTVHEHGISVRDSCSLHSCLTTKEPACSDYTHPNRLPCPNLHHNHKL